MQAHRGASGRSHGGAGGAKQQRVDFFNNVLGEQAPAVTRAVNTLLCAPVTACAASGEPHFRLLWSKWGASFSPDRTKLGLEVAQKMIFVQQNDPATRELRDMDVLVE